MNSIKSMKKNEKTSNKMDIEDDYDSNSENEKTSKKKNRFVFESFAERIEKIKVRLPFNQTNDTSFKGVEKSENKMVSFSEEDSNFKEHLISEKVVNQTPEFEELYYDLIDLAERYVGVIKNSNLIFDTLIKYIVKELNEDNIIKKTLGDNFFDFNSFSQLNVYDIPCFLDKHSISHSNDVDIVDIEEDEVSNKKLQTSEEIYDYADQIDNVDNVVLAKPTNLNKVKKTIYSTSSIKYSANFIISVLDLIVSLIKDVRDSNELINKKLMNKVFPLLICLLNSINTSENIDKCLNHIVNLIKFQSKIIGSKINFQPFIKIFMRLIADKRNYIRKFSAEALVFIFKNLNYEETDLSFIVKLCMTKTSQKLGIYLSEQFHSNSSDEHKLNLDVRCNISNYYIDEFVEILNNEENFSYYYNKEVSNYFSDCFLEILTINGTGISPFADKYFNKIITSILSKHVTCLDNFTLFSECLFVINLLLKLQKVLQTKNNKENNKKSSLLKYNTLLNFDFLVVFFLKISKLQTNSNSNSLSIFNDLNSVEYSKISKLSEDKKCEELMQVVSKNVVLLTSLLIYIKESLVLDYHINLNMIFKLFEIVENQDKKCNSNNNNNNNNKSFSFHRILIIEIMVLSLKSLDLSQNNNFNSFTNALKKIFSNDFSEFYINFILSKLYSISEVKSNLVNTSFYYYKFSSFNKKEYELNHNYVGHNVNNSKNNEIDSKGKANIDGESKFERKEKLINETLYKYEKLEFDEYDLEDKNEEISSVEFDFIRSNEKMLNFKSLIELIINYLHERINQNRKDEFNNHIIGLILLYKNFYEQSYLKFCKIQKPNNEVHTNNDEKSNQFILSMTIGKLESSSLNSCAFNSKSLDLKNDFSLIDSVYNMELSSLFLSLSSQIDNKNNSNSESENLSEKKSIDLFFNLRKELEKMSDNKDLTKKMFLYENLDFTWIYDIFCYKITHKSSNYYNNNELVNIYLRNILISINPLKRKKLINKEILSNNSVILSSLLSKPSGLNVIKLFDDDDLRKLWIIVSKANDNNSLNNSKIMNEGLTKLSSTSSLLKVLSRNLLKFILSPQTESRNESMIILMRTLRIFLDLDLDKDNNDKNRKFIDSIEKIANSVISIYNLKKTTMNSKEYIISIERLIITMESLSLISDHENNKEYIEFQHKFHFYILYSLYWVNSVKEVWPIVTKSLSRLFTVIKSYYLEKSSNDDKESDLEGYNFYLNFNNEFIEFIKKISSSDELIKRYYSLFRKDFFNFEHHNTNNLYLLCNFQKDDTSQYKNEDFDDDDILDETNKNNSISNSNHYNKSIYEWCRIMLDVVYERKFNGKLVCFGNSIYRESSTEESNDLVEKELAMNLTNKFSIFMTGVVNGLEALNSLLYLQDKDNNLTNKNNDSRSLSLYKSSLNFLNYHVETIRFSNTFFSVQNKFKEIIHKQISDSKYSGEKAVSSSNLLLEINIFYNYCLNNFYNASNSNSVLFTKLIQNLLNLFTFMSATLTKNQNQNQIFKENEYVIYKNSVFKNLVDVLEELLINSKSLEVQKLCILIYSKINPIVNCYKDILIKAIINTNIIDDLYNLEKIQKPKKNDLEKNELITHEERKVIIPILIRIYYSKYFSLFDNHKKKQKSRNKTNFTMFFIQLNEQEIEYYYRLMTKEVYELSDTLKSDNISINNFFSFFVFRKMKNYINIILMNFKQLKLKLRNFQYELVNLLSTFLRFSKIASNHIIINTTQQNSKDISMSNKVISDSNLDIFNSLKLLILQEKQNEENQISETSKNRFNYIFQQFSKKSLTNYCKHYLRINKEIRKVSFTLLKTIYHHINKTKEEKQILDANIKTNLIELFENYMEEIKESDDPTLNTMFDFFISLSSTSTLFLLENNPLIGRKLMSLISNVNLTSQIKLRIIDFVNEILNAKYEFLNYCEQRSVIQEDSKYATWMILDDEYISDEEDENLENYSIEDDSEKESNQLNNTTNNKTKINIESKNLKFSKHISTSNIHLIFFEDINNFVVNLISGRSLKGLNAYTEKCLEIILKIWTLINPNSINVLNKFTNSDLTFESLAYQNLGRDCKAIFEFVTGIFIKSSEETKLKDEESDITYYNNYKKSFIFREENSDFLFNLLKTTHFLLNYLKTKNDFNSDLYCQIFINMILDINEPNTRIVLCLILEEFHSIKDIVKRLLLDFNKKKNNYQNRISNSISHEETTDNFFSYLETFDSVNISHENNLLIFESLTVKDLEPIVYQFIYFFKADDFFVQSIISKKMKLLMKRIINSLFQDEAVEENESFKCVFRVFNVIYQILNSKSNRNVNSFNNLFSLVSYIMIYIGEVLRNPETILKTKLRNLHNKQEEVSLLFSNHIKIFQKLLCFDLIQNLSVNIEKKMAVKNGNELELKENENTNSKEDVKNNKSKKYWKKDSKSQIQSSDVNTLINQEKLFQIEALIHLKLSVRIVALDCLINRLEHQLERKIERRYSRRMSDIQMIATSTNPEVYSEEATTYNNNFSDISQKSISRMLIPYLLTILCPDDHDSSEFNVMTESKNVEKMLEKTIVLIEIISKILDFKNQMSLLNIIVDNLRFNRGNIEAKRLNYRVLSALLLNIKFKGHDGFSKILFKNLSEIYMNNYFNESLFNAFNNSNSSILKENKKLTTNNQVIQDDLNDLETLKFINLNNKIDALKKKKTKNSEKTNSSNNKKGEDNEEIKKNKSKDLQFLDPKETQAKLKSLRLNDSKAFGVAIKKVKSQYISPFKEMSNQDDRLMYSNYSRLLTKKIFPLLKEATYSNKKGKYNYSLNNDTIKPYLILLMQFDCFLFQQEFIKLMLEIIANIRSKEFSVRERARDGLFIMLDTIGNPILPVMINELKFNLHSGYQKIILSHAVGHLITKLLKKKNVVSVILKENTEKIGDEKMENENDLDEYDSLQKLPNNSNNENSIIFDSIMLNSIDTLLDDLFGELLEDKESIMGTKYPESKSRSFLTVSLLAQNVKSDNSICLLIYLIWDYIVKQDLNDTIHTKLVSLLNKLPDSIRNNENLNFINLFYFAFGLIIMNYESDLTKEKAEEFRSRISIKGLKGMDIDNVKIMSYSEQYEQSFTLQKGIDDYNRVTNTDKYEDMNRKKNERLIQSELIIFGIDLINVCTTSLLNGSVKIDENIIDSVNICLFIINYQLEICNSERFILKSLKLFNLLINSKQFSKQAEIYCKEMINIIFKYLSFSTNVELIQISLKILGDVMNKKFMVSNDYVQLKDFQLEVLISFTKLNISKASIRLSLFSCLYNLLKNKVLHRDVIDLILLVIDNYFSIEEVSSKDLATKIVNEYLKNYLSGIIDYLEIKDGNILLKGTKSLFIKNVNSKFSIKTVVDQWYQKVINILVVNAESQNTQYALNSIQLINNLVDSIPKLLLEIIFFKFISLYVSESINKDIKFELDLFYLQILGLNKNLNLTLKMMQSSKNKLISDNVSFIVSLTDKVNSKLVTNFNLVDIQKIKQNFKEKIIAYKSNNDANKLSLRAYLEFLSVLIKSEFVNDEFKAYKPYSKLKEKDNKETKDLINLFFDLLCYENYKTEKVIQNQAEENSEMIIKISIPNWEISYITLNIIEFLFTFYTELRLDMNYSIDDEETQISDEVNLNYKSIKSKEKREKELFNFDISDSYIMYQIIKFLEHPNFLIKCVSSRLVNKLIKLVKLKTDQNPTFYLSDIMINSKHFFREKSFAEFCYINFALLLMQPNIKENTLNYLMETIKIINKNVVNIVTESFKNKGKDNNNNNTNVNEHFYEPIESFISELCFESKTYLNEGINEGLCVSERVSEVLLNLLAEIKERNINFDIHSSFDKHVKTNVTIEFLNKILSKIYIYSSSLSTLNTLNSKLKSDFLSIINTISEILGEKGFSNLFNKSQNDKLLLKKKRKKLANN